MNQKASFLFVLIVGIALVTTLFRPQTAWLARAQFANLFTGSRGMVQTLTDLGLKHEDLPFSWAFPAVPPSDTKAAFAKVVAAQPSDTEVAVAAALQNKARLEALRALPPSALRDAAYLRMACLGEKALISLSNRNEDQDKFTRTSSPRKNKPVDAAKLEQALKIAQDGATRDTKNGFFPYMEATILYGLHRDREARAAVHRAALCPTFDDGIRAELDGTQRLREHAFGPQLGVIELAVAAAALFPHYATMRSTARLVAAQAREREQAGDIAGGLALRRDLMTSGEKLRDQASSSIGSLVGIALTAIGTSRYPGEPVIDEKAIPDTEERAELRLKAWESYATAHGAPELAQRARQNSDKRIQIKKNFDKTLHKSVMGPFRLLRLLGAHLAAANLLIVVLVVLVVGGVTGVLSKASTEPSLAYSLTAWVLVLTFCPLLLPFALWGVWNRATPTQRPLALLTVWLLPLLLTTVLAWLELAALVPSGGLMGLIQGLSTGEEGSAPTWSDFGPAFAAYGAGVGFLLLAPTAWLAIVTFVGAMKKQPLSVGIVRGAAQSALPFAAVLSLLYAVQLVGLAGQEAQFKAELREQARSEVAYFATHP